MQEIINLDESLLLNRHTGMWRCLIQEAHTNHTSIIFQHWHFSEAVTLIHTRKHWDLTLKKQG